MSFVPRAHTLLLKSINAQLESRNVSVLTVMTRISRLAPMTQASNVKTQMLPSFLLQTVSGIRWTGTVTAQKDLRH